MTLELSNLLAEIKTATSDILDKDLSKVRGFSKRQLKAIGVQTLLIKEGVDSGEISGELQTFFEESLKNMVTNFVNTLKGITAVILEKVWNAVVEILWKTIGFLI
ncbi:hypothetical protein [Moheibacter lacus]|uniref:Uncharacterized protein n=1 Tax=Moheibacter lacus TaxID=2745851 RepID=A0A838ZHP8_9FLAO|nr:hypothetical protein [Moheibacter lacus]MBA5628778.1 hypothetical protein [Moheibacter lacus]